MKCSLYWKKDCFEQLTCERIYDIHTKQPHVQHHVPNSLSNKNSSLSFYSRKSFTFFICTLYYGNQSRPFPLFFWYNQKRFATRHEGYTMKTYVWLGVFGASRKMCDLTVVIKVARTIRNTIVHTGSCDDKIENLQIWKSIYQEKAQWNI